MIDALLCCVMHLLTPGSVSRRTRDGLTLGPPSFESLCLVESHEVDDLIVVLWRDVQFEKSVVSVGPHRTRRWFDLWIEHTHQVYGASVPADEDFQLIVSKISCGLEVLHHCLALEKLWDVFLELLSELILLLIGLVAEADIGFEHEVHPFLDLLFYLLHFCFGLRVVSLLRCRAISYSIISTGEPTKATR
jgi:hypothetical protein